ncbi:SIS domain-containing protein [bacterium]|jgi:glucosamine--fructose-6-phosphate aminotransferase (isomerizing)|nr:SIS domain-containing protein [Verrucomicrobiales bacterium]MDB4507805.1 SIS domain-containing protein [bacterium]MDC0503645.1 SIS domain-containing protein [Verrucomicrobiales bacterium]
MNAGMVGEYAFEEFADIPSEVEQAAEFWYRNPIIRASDLVLAISQSGETADTLAAVREAIQKGTWVSGLCNVVGSTIARETGSGIYLHAGPEISAASTKAFTCRLAVLPMVALKFGRCATLSCSRGREIAEAIESIPELVERVLEQNDVIAKDAERWADTPSAFFIGRGYQFSVALEGALKLKEISYIHAEGYHATELKHGPIALLEDGIPVVALLNEGPGKEKTIGNVHECAARGARTVGVITEGDTDTASLLDSVIEVPACPDFVAPVPTAVTLQLLSCHVARTRGCAIDQPRNLAKSVTVE